MRFGPVIMQIAVAILPLLFLNGMRCTALSLFWPFSNGAAFTMTDWVALISCKALLMYNFLFVSQQRLTRAGE